MKVLVLSKYSRKGASSRFRMFQFFPGLQERGFELSVEPLLNDDYLTRLYSNRGRGFSVLKAYIQRIWILFFRKDIDVVWLEKEMFPWVPWFVEKWFFKMLNAPVIVDYDDAVFHQYDQHRFSLVRKLLGRKCDYVMKASAMMVGGNDYLNDRARNAGSQNIQKVPTVVSGQTFFPAEQDNKVPVIGWIGSMSTAVYLEKLRPVLARLSQRHSFRFRIVGAKVNWSDVPVECVPWRESEEVSLIQSFDIGVMPLLDSPWERGKCGFKLVQYMACGKAVVADPVGVNPEIVEDRKSGFLISGEMDWFTALEKLLLDKELRTTMGMHGRDRFLQRYSLERWEKDLAQMFQKVVGTE